MRNWGAPARCSGVLRQCVRKPQGLPLALGSCRVR